MELRGKAEFDTRYFNQIKRNIGITLLFVVFPLVCFPQKRDTLKFLELGIGAGYSPEMHGAINVGVAVNLNNYLMNFIEYNMFTSGSSIYGHEINYKIGPYFKFGRNSYVSLSSGLSLIYVSSQLGNYKSNYFSPMTPEKFVVNIPIQLRINFGINERICFGFKGNYNKPVEDYFSDKGTALIYFAFKI